MGKILSESSKSNVKVDLYQNICASTSSEDINQPNFFQKIGSRISKFDLTITTEKSKQKKPEPQDYSDEMPVSPEFRERVIKLDATLSKWMPGFNYLVPKEYTKLDDTDYTPIHVPVMQIMHKFFLSHLILAYSIIGLMTFVLMDEYEAIAQLFNGQQKADSNHPWILLVYMVALSLPAVLGDFCLMHCLFKAIRHNRAKCFVAFEIYKYFWVITSSVLAFWDLYLIYQALESGKEIKHEIHLPLLGLLSITFWVFIGLFRLFRNRV